MRPRFCSGGVTKQILQNLPDSGRDFLDLAKNTLDWAVAAPL